MIIHVPTQVLVVLAIVVTGGVAGVVAVNFVCLQRVSAEYYIATINVTNNTPFTVTLMRASADIFDSSGQRIAVADVERPTDQDYVAIFDQNKTVTLSVGIQVLIPESQLYEYTEDEVFDVKVSLTVQGGFLTITVPYAQSVSSQELLAEVEV